LLLFLSLLLVLVLVLLTEPSLSSGIIGDGGEMRHAASSGQVQGRAAECLG